MRTSRQFATTQHDVRADFLYGDGTGRYGASRLARRHPCSARDDLRQRQGRCARRQRSLPSVREFLPGDPRLCLAEPPQ